MSYYVRNAKILLGITDFISEIKHVEDLWQIGARNPLQSTVVYS